MDLLIETAPTEIDSDSEGPQTSDSDESQHSRRRNRWPTGDEIKHLLAMHQPLATRSLKEVALPL